MMRWRRFSLATAFVLLTYLCIVAAAGGFYLRNLSPGFGDEVTTVELAWITVLGVVFFIASAVMGGFVLYRWSQALASGKWQKTTALVLSPVKPPQRWWRSEQPAFHRAQLQYEFDGRTFTSAAWTNKYYAGDQLTVFVDPRNPGDHSIEIAAGEPQQLGMMLLLSLGMGSMGAAAATEAILRMVGGR